jgi:hypothetical protein
MKIIRFAALVTALVFSVSGCLPGSEAALAPVSPKTPSDDVFIKLFEAVEGRRQDQFIGLVSASASPDRDTLYRRLTEFYAGADNIEFQITVDRRLVTGDDVTYVFDWERRISDRTTGTIVNARGRTEWTFSRGSGRYLLKLMTGSDVF